MKKYFLFVTIFILMMTTIAFSYPYENDVYPYVCGSQYYARPGYSVNQPPSYNGNVSNPSYYYLPELQASGKNIIVFNPQIVYDNDGLIPIGNFVERAGKNYFMYLNGVFARNTWLKRKGKWYFFDNSSEMVKGFCTINGLQYYFNNDGSMATGTTIINGVTHYFDAVGTMVY